MADSDQRLRQIQDRIARLQMELSVELKLLGQSPHNQTSLARARILSQRIEDLDARLPFNQGEISRLRGRVAEQYRAIAQNTDDRVRTAQMQRQIEALERREKTMSQRSDVGKLRDQILRDLDRNINEMRQVRARLRDDPRNTTYRSRLAWLVHWVDTQVSRWNSLPGITGTPTDKWPLAFPEDATSGQWEKIVSVSSKLENDFEFGQRMTPPVVKSITTTQRSMQPSSRTVLSPSERAVVESKPIQRNRLIDEIRRQRNQGNLTRAHELEQQLTESDRVREREWADEMGLLDAMILAAKGVQLPENSTVKRTTGEVLSRNALIRPAVEHLYGGPITTRNPRGSLSADADAALQEALYEYGELSERAAIGVALDPKVKEKLDRDIKTAQERAALAYQKKLQAEVTRLLQGNRNPTDEQRTSARAQALKTVGDHPESFKLSPELQARIQAYNDTMYRARSLSMLTTHELDPRQIQRLAQLQDWLSNRLGPIHQGKLDQMAKTAYYAVVAQQANRKRRAFAESETVRRGIGTSTLSDLSDAQFDSLMEVGGEDPAIPEILSAIGTGGIRSAADPFESSDGEYTSFGNKFAAMGYTLDDLEVRRSALSNQDLLTQAAVANDPIVVAAKFGRTSPQQYRWVGQGKRPRELAQEEQRNAAARAYLRENRAMVQHSYNAGATGGWQDEIYGGVTEEESFRAKRPSTSAYRRISSAAYRAWARKVETSEWGRRLLAQRGMTPGLFGRLRARVMRGFIMGGEVPARFTQEYVIPPARLGSPTIPFAGQTLGLYRQLRSAIPDTMPRDGTIASLRDATWALIKDRVKIKKGRELEASQQLQNAREGLKKFLPDDMSYTPTTARRARQDLWRTYFGDESENLPRRLWKPAVWPYKSRAMGREQLEGSFATDARYRRIHFAASMALPDTAKSLPPRFQFDPAFTAMGQSVLVERTSPYNIWRQLGMRHEVTSELNDAYNPLGGFDEIYMASRPLVEQRRIENTAKGFKEVIGASGTIHPFVSNYGSFTEDDLVQELMRRSDLPYRAPERLRDDPTRVRAFYQKAIGSLFTAQSPKRPPWVETMFKGIDPKLLHTDSVRRKLVDSLVARSLEARTDLDVEEFGDHPIRFNPIEHQEEPMYKFFQVSTAYEGVPREATTDYYQRMTREPFISSITNLARGNVAESVLKELGLGESGNPDTVFVTPKTGQKFAQGYLRLLHGDTGTLVEFLPQHLDPTLSTTRINDTDAATKFGVDDEPDLKYFLAKHDLEYAQGVNIDYRAGRYYTKLADLISDEAGDPTIVPRLHTQTSSEKEILSQQRLDVTRPMFRNPREVTIGHKTSYHMHQGELVEQQQAIKGFNQSVLDRSLSKQIISDIDPLTGQRVWLGEPGQFIGNTSLMEQDWINDQMIKVYSGFPFIDLIEANTPVNKWTNPFASRLRAAGPFVKIVRNFVERMQDEKAQGALAEMRGQELRQHMPGRRAMLARRSRYLKGMIKARDKELAIITDKMMGLVHGGKFETEAERQAFHTTMFNRLFPTDMFTGQNFGGFWEYMPDAEKLKARALPKRVWNEKTKRWNVSYPKAIRELVAPENRRAFARLTKDYIERRWLGSQRHEDYFGNNRTASLNQERIDRSNTIGPVDSLDTFGAVARTYIKSLADDRRRNIKFDPRMLDEGEFNELLATPLMSRLDALKALYGGIDPFTNTIYAQLREQRVASRGKSANIPGIGAPKIGARLRPDTTAGWGYVLNALWQHSQYDSTRKWWSGLPWPYLAKDADAKQFLDRIADGSKNPMSYTELRQFTWLMDQAAEAYVGGAQKGKLGAIPHETARGIYKLLGIPANQIEWFMGAAKRHFPAGIEHVDTWNSDYLEEMMGVAMNLKPPRVAQMPPAYTERPVGLYGNQAPTNRGPPEPLPRLPPLYPSVDEYVALAVKEFERHLRMSPLRFSFETTERLYGHDEAVADLEQKYGPELARRMLAGDNPFLGTSGSPQPGSTPNPNQTHLGMANFFDRDWSVHPDEKLGRVLGPGSRNWAKYRVRYAAGPDHAAGTRKLHQELKQLFPQLTDEQLTAALYRVGVHGSGDLAVTAAAGTGKTTALVARTVSLLLEGVPANRILNVTFTRAAAKKMNEDTIAAMSFAKEQGVIGADQWAGQSGNTFVGRTIHSVANEIVQGGYNRIAHGLSTPGLETPWDWNRADLGGRFSQIPILGRRQAQKFMLQAMRYINGEPDNGEPPETIELEDLRNVSRQIRDWKAQLMDPSDVEKWLTTKRWAGYNLKNMHWLSGIYTMYQYYLRDAKVLDPDDLLMKATIMLGGKDKPDDPNAMINRSPLARVWANKFDYINIDEYQDVSESAAKFLKLLINRHGTEPTQLAMFGDYMQAIYHFLEPGTEGYGTIGRLLGNLDRSSNVSQIHMLTNFRSDPTLIAMAAAISGRKEHAPEGTALRRQSAFFRQVLTPADEAGSVLEDIEKFIALNAKHGNIEDPMNWAITARADRALWNPEGTGVVNELLKRGIDFTYLPADSTREEFEGTREFNKLMKEHGTRRPGAILVGNIFKLKGLEADRLFALGLEGGEGGTFPSRMALRSVSGPITPKMLLSPQSGSELESERNVAYTLFSRPRRSAMFYWAHHRQGSNQPLGVSPYVKFAGAAISNLQPVPEFAVGSHDTPGGLALVGENGPELVSGKHSLKIVGKRGPEIAFIEKGAQVLPAHKTRHAIGLLGRVEGEAREAPWIQRYPDTLSKPTQIIWNWYTRKHSGLMANLRLGQQATAESPQYRPAWYQGGPGAKVTLPDEWTDPVSIAQLLRSNKFDRLTAAVMTHGLGLNIDDLTASQHQAFVVGHELGHHVQYSTTPNLGDLTYGRTIDLYQLQQDQRKSKDPWWQYNAKYQQLADEVFATNTAIRAMVENAKELGLPDTVFANHQGFRGLLDQLSSGNSKLLDPLMREGHKIRALAVGTRDFYPWIGTAGSPEIEDPPFDFDDVSDNFANKIVEPPSIDDLGGSDDVSPGAPPPIAGPTRPTATQMGENDPGITRAKRAAAEHVEISPRKTSKTRRRASASQQDVLSIGRAVDRPFLPDNAVLDEVVQQQRQLKKIKYNPERAALDLFMTPTAQRQAAEMIAAAKALPPEQQTEIAMDPIITQHEKFGSVITGWQRHVLDSRIGEQADATSVTVAYDKLGAGYGHLHVKDKQGDRVRFSTPKDRPDNDISFGEKWLQLLSTFFPDQEQSRFMVAFGGGKGTDSVAMKLERDKFGELSYRDLPITMLKDDDLDVAHALYKEAGGKQSFATAASQNSSLFARLGRPLGRIFGSLARQQRPAQVTPGRPDMPGFHMDNSPIMPNINWRAIEALGDLPTMPTGDMLGEWTDVVPGSKMRRGIRLEAPPEQNAAPESRERFYKKFAAMRRQVLDKVGPNGERYEVGNMALVRNAQGDREAWAPVAVAKDPSKLIQVEIVKISDQMMRELQPFLAANQGKSEAEGRQIRAEAMPEWFEELGKTLDKTGVFPTTSRSAVEEDILAQFWNDRKAIVKYGLSNIPKLSETTPISAEGGVKADRPLVDSYLGTAGSPQDPGGSGHWTTGQGGQWVGGGNFNPPPPPPPPAAAPAPSPTGTGGQNAASGIRASLQGRLNNAWNGGPNQTYYNARRAMAVGWEIGFAGEILKGNLDDRKMLAVYNDSAASKALAATGLSTANTLGSGVGQIPMDQIAARMGQRHTQIIDTATRAGLDQRWRMTGMNTSERLELGAMMGQRLGTAEWAQGDPEVYKMLQEASLPIARASAILNEDSLQTADRVFTLMSQFGNLPGARKLAQEGNIQGLTAATDRWASLIVAINDIGGKEGLEAATGVGKFLGPRTEQYGLDPALFGAMTTVGAKNNLTDRVMAQFFTATGQFMNMGTPQQRYQFQRLVAPDTLRKNASYQQIQSALPELFEGGNMPSLEEIEYGIGRRQATQSLQNINVQAAILPLQQQIEGYQYQMERLGAQEQIVRGEHELKRWAPGGTATRLTELGFRQRERELELRIKELERRPEMRALQNQYWQANYQYQLGALNRSQQSLNFQNWYNQMMYGSPNARAAQQIAAAGWQQNQIIAGRSSLGTNLALQQPVPLNATGSNYGLAGEEFMANYEHQRNQLFFGRSKLMSGAAMQDNLKYLDKQKEFFERRAQIEEAARAMAQKQAQEQIDAQREMLEIQKQLHDKELEWQARQDAHDKEMLEIERERIQMERTAFEEEKSFRESINKIAAQQIDLQKIIEQLYGTKVPTPLGTMTLHEVRQAQERGQISSQQAIASASLGLMDMLRPDRQGENQLAKAIPDLFDERGRPRIDKYLSYLVEAQQQWKGSPQGYEIERAKFLQSIGDEGLVTATETLLNAEEKEPGSIVKSQRYIRDRMAWNDIKGITMTQDELWAQLGGAKSVYAHGRTAGDTAESAYYDQMLTLLGRETAMSENLAKINTELGPASEAIKNAVFGVQQFGGALGIAQTALMLYSGTMAASAVTQLGINLFRGKGVAAAAGATAGAAAQGGLRGLIGRAVPWVGRAGAPAAAAIPLAMGEGAASVGLETAAATGLAGSAATGGIGSLLSAAAAPAAIVALVGAALEFGGVDWIGKLTGENKGNIMKEELDVFGLRIPTLYGQLRDSFDQMNDFLNSPETKDFEKSVNSWGSQAWQTVSGAGQSLLSGQLPNIQLPQVDMPQIGLPRVDLSSISLPEIQIPRITLPEITLPDVGAAIASAVSGIRMPEIRMPTYEEAYKAVRGSLGASDDPTILGRLVRAVAGQNPMIGAPAQFISQVPGALWNGAAQASDALRGAQTQLGQGITSGVQQVVPWALGQYNQANSWYQQAQVQVGQQVISGAGQLANTAIQTAQAAPGAVASAATSAASFVAENAPAIGEQMLERLTAPYNAMVDLWNALPGIWNQTIGSIDFVAIATGIGNGLAEGDRIFREWQVNLGNAIVTFFVSTIPGFISSAIQPIAGAVQAILDFLYGHSVINDWMASLSAGWSTFWSVTLPGVISASITALTTPVSDGLNAISQTLTNWWNGIITWWSENVKLPEIKMPSSILGIPIPGMTSGSSGGALGGDTSFVAQPGQNVAPNQFTQGTAEGLPLGVASTICGPTMAVGFARAMGRNPTLAEAVQLATQMGTYTPGVGTNGAAQQSRLMSAMNIPHVMTQGVDWNRAAAEAAIGRPVGFSTRDHYYMAQGYNPLTGQFNVGETGLVMRGGKAWMTREEMEGLAGPADAAFYLQNVLQRGPGMLPDTMAGSPGQTASYAIGAQLASGFLDVVKTRSAGSNLFGQSAVANMATAIQGVNNVASSFPRYTPQTSYTPQPLNDGYTTPQVQTMANVRGSAAWWALHPDGIDDSDVVPAQTPAFSSQAPTYAAPTATQQLYTYGGYDYGLNPGIIQPAATQYTPDYLGGLGAQMTTPATLTTPDYQSSGLGALLGLVQTVAAAATPQMAQAGSGALAQAQQQPTTKVEIKLNQTFNLKLEEEEKKRWQQETIDVITAALQPFLGGSAPQ